MSHYSANIPYYLIAKGNASYFIQGHVDERYVEEIHLAMPFRLSAFIHEINECEVTHLLEEQFREDIKKSLISVTKNMLKQATNNFKKEKIFEGVNERVFISHMVSPYATGNCFMPRRKYRVFW